MRSRRPDATTTTAPLLTISEAETFSSRIASVVVSPAGFDDLGRVLKSLGILFQQCVWWEVFARAVDSARIAFVNCSRGAVRPVVLDALRRLLRRGGVVFATDWASEYLEQLQINGLSFHGRVGVVEVIDSELVESELRSLMGRPRLRLRFDTGTWVPVRSVPTRARVLLRGDVQMRTGWFRRKTLTGVPLAFSIEVGGGRVFFTSFHNRAQMTALERTLLSLLVIDPIASARGRSITEEIVERRLGGRLGLDDRRSR